MERGRVINQSGVLKTMARVAFSGGAVIGCVLIGCPAALYKAADTCLVIGYE